MTPSKHILISYSKPFVSLEKFCIFVHLNSLTHNIHGKDCFELALSKPLLEDVRLVVLCCEGRCWGRCPQGSSMCCCPLAARRPRGCRNAPSAEPSQRNTQLPEEKNSFLLRVSPDKAWYHAHWQGRNIFRADCYREENKGEIRAARSFPGGSMVKKPQELQAQSLGQNDPLEKEMATHSSILARRIPWTEEPGGLWSMGLQRVGHNLATKQVCHCRGHTFQLWFVSHLFYYLPYHTLFLLPFSPPTSIVAPIWLYVFWKYTLPLKMIWFYVEI